MPAEYGQKRWDSAGMPVLVDEDAGVFLDIRLFRYGAISGTVVDENDEGLANQRVVAYRMSSPPEVVAHASTDERGIYRLHGLVPGTYTVRTAGDQSDAESYLPTYTKETDTMGQAQTVELLPDFEANGVDLRPLPGRLYNLTAEVKAQEGADVSITLVSETGRETVEDLSHRFANLPPGDYELIAESPAKPEPGDRILGGYQRVYLGANMDVTLILQNLCTVTVSGAPDSAAGEIMLRPADLAGSGPAAELPVTHGAATVPAGRWEVMLQPPAGYYVSDVSPLRGRPDGWQRVTSPGYRSLNFTLSAGPSAIHGTVKNSDDLVPGALVYLEPYDPVADRRVAGLHVAYADMRGQYRFDDLAPGTYRILSTFEYLAPDTATMAAAGAAVVTVGAHSGLSRDLDLYVIR